MAPRWNQNNETPDRKLGVSDRSRVIRRRPLFQGVVGVRAQRRGRLYTIREIQILGRDISQNHEEEMAELSLMATRTMTEQEPPMYIDVTAGRDVELRDEEFFYMEPILFLRDDYDIDMASGCGQAVESESSSEEDEDGEEEEEADANEEEEDAEANEEEEDADANEEEDEEEDEEAEEEANEGDTDESEESEQGHSTQ